MASNNTDAFLSKDDRDRIAAAFQRKAAAERERIPTVRTPSNPIKKRQVKLPSSFAAQVTELHRLFGMDIDQPLDYALIRRYGERLDEEMTEASEAMAQLRLALVLKGDAHPDILGLVTNLLKELMDVHYMASVFSVVFGWDEEEAFRRVHQSNMSKVGDDGRPVFHPDGKIVKTHNYQPPVLEDLV
jgi:predicted HAD superfamily Cof-like phosphohydrolase